MTGLFQSDGGPPREISTDQDVNADAQISTASPRPEANLRARAFRAMPSWSEIFGPELLSHKGLVKTEVALKTKCIVGIYFSAKSCIPCREFTPLLATIYDDMIEEYPDFEIVYVSSDEHEEDFAEYFAEMPWTAVPFSSGELRKDLKDDYTSLIPWLAFHNGNGDFLTDDGRAIVSEAHGDVKRIWNTLMALNK